MGSRSWDSAQDPRASSSAQRPGDVRAVFLVEEDKELLGWVTSFQHLGSGRGVRLDAGKRHKALPNVLLASLWVLRSLGRNCSVWVWTEHHLPGLESDDPQEEAVEETIILCA